MGWGGGENCKSPALTHPNLLILSYITMLFEVQKVHSFGYCEELRINKELVGQILEKSSAIHLETIRKVTTIIEHNQ
jgi:hypothetical protein